MAFKKRVTRLNDTEVNMTTEYGRNKKVKQNCSLVLNGLLIASMVMGVGTSAYANGVEVPNVGGIESSIGADDVATDELEEFNEVMVARAEERANVKETKLAGGDRYKTAVNVSKASWSTSSKAILINGTALPDALTATPLAEEYNAPILLTEKNNLNQDTLNELKRLGVKEVTLIGSDGVISEVQANTLKSQGFIVERIGGADRVDTSLKVAYKLKDLYAKKGGTQRKTVFIANGVKGLSDATSVASPAGFKDAVILYTDGTNISSIKSYITSSSDDVYLVGGTSVISSVIENELKTTTNKKITRLNGTDRKDTNAKVVNEFFPNKDINKVYVAKDGSGDEGQLVDALAVGSLAGREKNPVIIASDKLSDSQSKLIDNKEIKEVVQVGEGRNTNVTKQVVGIINAVAQPEPSDGMKLPTINFAKEQNVKFPYKYAGASGGVGENVIDGDLYVKFGSPDVGLVSYDRGKFMHTYGSGNQEQYNKSVSYVKDALKSINFRYEPEWVYMQHYFNGGKADSFVDSILKQKGINTTYGQWKNSNKVVIDGIKSKKLSRADAEKLAMYHSATVHVERKINAKQLSEADDWTAWSAYQVITNKVKDTDSIAQLRLLVADIIGLNAMIAGGLDTTLQSECIQLGNYWWANGKYILNKSNTKIPVLKADDPLMCMDGVFEAPTYYTTY